MIRRAARHFGLFLFGVAFVVSVARVVFFNDSRSSPGSGDTVTIRLAHWQLENGVRETFDRIAAAYTARHPNVRVEQIAIPDRIYANWFITQLVGGTAPDILQLGSDVQGTTDERVARFFAPLGDLADAPNPYNADTPLADVPLRETYLDGMGSGYKDALLDYYSLPISGSSTRLFYNLDLLEKITGHREPPRDYRAFIALCEAAEEYARGTGQSLVPIAGSKFNAPYLMADLFASQTQTLARDTSPTGELRASPITQGLAYLRGDWTLDAPGIRSGLALTRQVATHMQPGFTQLDRDDAMLLFVQGRALMICSGSWDATGLRAQSPFPVGAARVPFPSPDDPDFGEQTLDVPAERASTGITFGLNRASEHPDVARDFLRFLASQPVNQLWTDSSGWVPAVLGVTPTPEVAVFLPDPEGFPLHYKIAADGMGDLRRVFENALYRLYDPRGGVDAFLDEIRGDYRAAWLSDLARLARSRHESLQRSDTQAAALAWLAARPDADPGADRRRSMAFESAAVAARDVAILRLRESVAQPDPTSP